MPKATSSPFKEPRISDSPLIAPPQVIKHSSSPTKRSFSRPGLGSVTFPASPSKVPQSPTKLRSRSPERPRPRKFVPAHQLWTYYLWFFNCIMALIALRIMLTIFIVFRNDVHSRVEKQSAGVIFEIQECARQYMSNKCMPGQRVPVLDELCNRWEQCMKQDPQKVLHSQLFAESLSDALGSFLAPMSWKTVAFLTTLFVFIPVFVNSLSRNGKNNSPVMMVYH